MSFVSEFVGEAYRMCEMSKQRELRSASKADGLFSSILFYSLGKVTPLI
jgi:hypothetical protein